MAYAFKTSAAGDVGIKIVGVSGNPTYEITMHEDASGTTAGYLCDSRGGVGTGYLRGREGTTTTYNAIDNCFVNGESVSINTIRSQIQFKTWVAGDVIAWRVTSPSPTDERLLINYIDAGGPGLFAVSQIKVTDDNGTRSLEFPANGQGSTITDPMGLLTITVVNAPVDHSQWVPIGGGGGTTEVTNTLTVSTALRQMLSAQLSLASSMRQRVSRNLSASTAFRQRLEKTLGLTASTRQTVANTVNTATTLRQRIANGLSLSTGIRSRVATTLGTQTGFRQRLAKTLNLLVDFLVQGGAITRTLAVSAAFRQRATDTLITAIGLRQRVAQSLTVTASLTVRINGQLVMQTSVRQSAETSLSTQLSLRQRIANTLPMTVTINGVALPLPRPASYDILITEASYDILITEASYSIGITEPSYQITIED